MELTGKNTQRKYQAAPNDYEVEQHLLCWRVLLHCIKLNDKKVSKATNAQMIELTPAMVLDQSKTFKYGYRNVLVLKKMTFPNDKVLTIEISEKQISGRTISLDIDYEDVLYADSYNSYLMMEE